MVQRRRTSKRKKSEILNTPVKQNTQSSTPDSVVFLDTTHGTTTVSARFFTGILWSI